MKELNLYPLMGLYQELYTPDLHSLSLEPLKPQDRWSLKRSNGLFWAQLLNPLSVEKLIERIKNNFSFSHSQTPQFDAVLKTPKLFIKKISEAPSLLANLAASPQTFFSAVETLTILCNLYSEFVYKPFRLTVDDGFLLDDFSSKKLVEECLNPISNPYFGFIQEHCWPVLEAMKPDMIWMLGPIRFSTFTLAMLARKAFPDVHISVVEHSSEYYSLNKITKYLERNTILFSIIDSIILDDAEHSQEKLAHCLASRDSISSVPNILYIDRISGQIQKTIFEVSKKNVVNWVALRPTSFPNDEVSGNVIDPSKLANVKLWPDAKCYWNHCTFCGINHKYHTLPEWNNFDDIPEKADFIRKLIEENGCQYFWLIDEAVPPESLERFAIELTQKNLSVYWQARSRIDVGFTEQVCQTLAKSGLREIRLGLESVNERILKLMDKFPEDITLELIEKIVSCFHKNGVSVHFPMIIGFPTENQQERAETFEFLQHLKKKYPTFTFNVNALDLDVASKLFRQYEDFDITSIRWSCPSKYFLGNFVEWDSDIEHYDKNLLDAQRSNFMRQVLYPWMPKTALTPTFIFYRLSETCRITLLWKTGMHDAEQGNGDDLSMGSLICTSPDLAVSDTKKRKGKINIYRVYDWDTHNFLECDEDGVKLLELFSSSRTVSDGLNTFQHEYLADALSIEQIATKYLPQLQIANKYKLIRRL